VMQAPGKKTKGGVSNHLKRRPSIIQGCAYAKAPNP
jgi:hypothetical protein